MAYCIDEITMTSMYLPHFQYCSILVTIENAYLSVCELSAGDGWAMLFSMLSFRIITIKKTT